MVKVLSKKAKKAKKAQTITIRDVFDVLKKSFYSLFASKKSKSRTDIKKTPPEISFPRTRSGKMYCPINKKNLDYQSMSVFKNAKVVLKDNILTVVNPPIDTTRYETE
jgi:hypothetical protein